jgi:hypothetical protein
MDDVELIEQTEEEPAMDRVRESVRHALRLVGPAEGGAERLWPDDSPVSRSAARAR